MDFNRSLVISDSYIYLTLKIDCNPFYALYSRFYQFFRKRFQFIKRMIVSLLTIQIHFSLCGCNF